MSLRPIDADEYDAATRRAPAACPFYAMGDRRRPLPPTPASPYQPYVRACVCVCVCARVCV